MLMYLKIRKILKLEYKFTTCTLLSDGELCGGCVSFLLNREEVKMDFLDYTLL